MRLTDEYVSRVLIGRKSISTLCLARHGEAFSDFAASPGGPLKQGVIKMVRRLWSKNSLRRNKGPRSGRIIKQRNKQAESALSELDPVQRIDAGQQRAAALAADILRKETNE